MRFRARTNSVRRTSIAKGAKPSTLVARNPQPIRRSESPMRIYRSKRAQIFDCLIVLALGCTLGGCSSYGGGGGGGGGNGSAPAVVMGLTATAGNAQVGLTWNSSSGATGYYVKRSTTSGTEAQIAAQATTSFTDTAVTNGTKYFYTVSAYNSYGVSADSSEVSATPQAPMTAP